MLTTTTTTIKNLLAKLRSAVTSSESASAAAEGLDKWQRHMRNQVLRRREAKQQKQPRRKAKHVKAKASARRPPPFRRARYCEVAFPPDDFPSLYYYNYY